MRQTTLATAFFILGAACCQAQGIEAGALAPPIVTGNSLELCLNSRYSQHSLRGTASVRQLSNVLWAAGRMPCAGSYRDIYAVTPTGTYLYDPNRHALKWHSAEVTGEA
jgi:hypothetical protein